MNGNQAEESGVRRNGIRLTFGDVLCLSIAIIGVVACADDIWLYATSYFQ